MRSHALGNDYLVVDGATFGIALTPERVRLICDRNLGVGSDGILEAVAPPDGFDAAVRIYNPDGGEAEKSGNGVRIFAKFCEDHGYTAAGARIRIHTKGGSVAALTISRTASATMMKTEMGRAGGFVDRRLMLDGREYRTTSLSIGNPHCVVFDAPFDEQTARAIGPLIETHPWFPGRTNVQLIRVVDRSTVHALIWERGAGFTRASGSSACAVAAAAFRAGLVDREVQVVMPGGPLGVTVHEDWSIEQLGPAVEVCRATISLDLAAQLATL